MATIVNNTKFSKALVCFALSFASAFMMIVLTAVIIVTGQSVTLCVTYVLTAVIIVTGQSVTLCVTYVLTTLTTIAIAGYCAYKMGQAS